jgi:hypothetical protein
MLLVVGLCVGGTLAVSAAPPEFVITGDDSDARYECWGTTAAAGVVITGSNNTVKLIGTCGALTINGNRNTVASDTIGDIVIKGRENTVTYKKAAKGAKPKVSDLGKDNKVKKVK